VLNSKRFEVVVEVEWEGYKKLTFFYQYLAFISKTVQHTVTIEGKWKVAYDLSIGAIFNDLERP